MNNDLISVIIPIYNIEDYVRTCVNSVIKQSYKNIEILLIDDGAKDKSGVICDELAKTDSRIKVFHKENGGLSDARNYGIKKSNGKYITTIDGDDYVGENYIYNLYNLLVENDADISSTNRNMLYEENNNVTIKKDEKFCDCIDTKLYNSENYLRELFRNKLPHEAWAKLYKREIFKEKKYQKGLKVYEDLEFIVRALQDSNFKIVCDTSIYDYFYRVRVTSIMREKYNEYWEKELDYYVSLLKSSKYEKYKREICALLATTCWRNFNKLLEENAKYPKVKNIQKNAKYVQLKYCKNREYKIKIFLIKFFPLFLFFGLKFKRKMFLK